jgi:hypothetical protein
LRSAYERVHAENMWNIEKAMRTGKKREADELLDKGQRDRDKLGRDIAEAEAVGRGCSGEVLWPGKED